MVEGAEPGVGKGRWVGVLQLGLVIAVTVLALYFMRTPEMADLSDISARPATGPLQVEVVRPSARQRTLTAELMGAVALHGSVGLNSQVSGRVIWVSPKLRDGGVFEAGETLLRIDPEDFELAVQRAEAKVEKQRARMRGYEIAGNEPQAARFKAAMEEAQAELAATRLALSRTDFSLPFDGKVSKVQVEVGALLAPSVPFGISYPLTAIEVTAATALHELAGLAPAVGRSAEVFFGGPPLPATVERVSAEVDTRSRMATLHLKFTDAVPPAALPLPGAFAQVAVAGRTINDAFALPDAAERPDGGVWVVDDGVLRSASPQSYGRDRTGWIVAAFDAADGVVVGPVPAGAEGLAVEPVVADGSTP